MHNFEFVGNAGVHSALKHDKIVNSSNSDYLIVEAEADSVAKQAVDALKQSRERCLATTSGVPTWTGQSGLSGAPPGVGVRYNVIVYLVYANVTIMIFV